MYGAPASAPVQAATPPPAAVTKTQTAVQSAPTSVASGSSGGAPAEEAAPASSEPAAPTEQSTTPSSDIVVSSNTELKNIQEPAQQHVSRSQILTAGKAPWSGVAVALIGAGAISLFLLRHAVAWRRVIRHGEQLILHHQLLDILFVAAAVLAVVLSRSTGVIR
jgi:hypothetical protein